MFRQIFLLSQYSFIWVQYFKCSDVMCTQYFLTAVFFFLVVTNCSKKSLRKNRKQLNVETDLTSVWQKRQLLRLIKTAFDSKVVSLRRMRKKNLITLQIINKQIISIKTYLPPDQPFFVCRLLTFELSSVNWKCTKNCNILTEYMTVLYLKFYSNVTLLGDSYCVMCVKHVD